MVVRLAHGGAANHRLNYRTASSEWGSTRAEESAVAGHLRRALSLAPHHAEWAAALAYALLRTCTAESLAEARGLQARPLLTATHPTPISQSEWAAGPPAPFYTTAPQQSRLSLSGMWVHGLKRFTK